MWSVISKYSYVYIVLYFIGNKSFILSEGRPGLDPQYCEGVNPHAVLSTNNNLCQRAYLTPGKITLRNLFENIIKIVEVFYL